MVAFSGGPDSMALLHLLRDLAFDTDLRLEAAHFDHGIRSDSREESRRVVDMAAGLGIRCHVGGPPSRPGTTQASLRITRYRWLEEVRRDLSAARIAVGHHADDQAETVLFRLMRGTDVRGLAGIPIRRGPIVRPLLPLRRYEIVHYLKCVGASWISDPSNMDRRWTRARIRADIMPELERRLPDVVPRLVSLGKAAAGTDRLYDRAAMVLLHAAVLESDCDGAVELRREVLIQADPELLARALRRVARARGVVPSHGGTRAAVEFISEGRSGGRVMLGGGLEVAREYDRVIISGKPKPVDAKPLLVHPGPGGGSLRLGSRAFDVRWKAVSAAARHPDRIAVAVPLGHYPLMFREWRHGDRIRLPAGTRKVSRLFGDRRVPVRERSRVPVLADMTGNVLWVQGLATAVTDARVEYEESLLEFELRHE
jgi:tRNA(Ile)-lysidine synthase